MQRIFVEKVDHVAILKYELYKSQLPNCIQKSIDFKEIDFRKVLILKREIFDPSMN